MKIKEMQVHPFLKGGGEMGELIRAKDWSQTVIGNPETWPQSLQISVSILLNSQFPMFVWWGPELTTIYNDAYRVIAGEKHPSLLGASGREGWSEIWDDLDPLVESVFEGTSTWSEDQPLTINRRGYLEETYFTFSYSPILDATAKVGGLFCAVIETTEKVLGARKIQENERNLRSTILQSPVAMSILKGSSFVVEIANDHMIELWGRAPEDLLHKPIFEGLPEAKLQGFEEMLQQVYATGISIKGNERPITLPRNGRTETIYINFVYEPFRDGDRSISGVIVVATDVTDQVLARKKIEESEQELQLRVAERTLALETQKKLVDNILKNSSNGISVTEMIRDEDGNIIDARTVLANEAAVIFTGLPHDVYLASTARQIDPGILESDYGQTCLRTLSTGEPSLSQYYLEMTGKWLELTISKMDKDHLIHIFTDVTPIKEAQLQLEKSIEELRHSNANLEEFAYAASHDLKEPIRKIHFFSDRLKSELEDKLTENQRLLFERLTHASNRMGTLIDDLLAYSQVSRSSDDQEEIDLNQKVQMALEDLELEVQQKGASIVAGPLPKIKGNGRQLQQLFQNLVSNALKYSKKDVAPFVQIASRVVRGNNERADLPAKEGSRLYHLIEVKDNGIGFDQADAERIFNIFTRLHGNAEYRGSGVGLSMVRKVVENYQGYVWAESQPGEGSTFKVMLPEDL
ncbi:MAG: PAS domain-containing sensor histidine kinase [Flavisolibacter sp.]